MTALLQFNEQSIHFRLDRFTSVVILPKVVELRYFVLLQQLQQMMIHVGLGGFEQLGGGVGVDHLDQLLLVELFLPVVDQNVENLLFPLVPVLDVELDLIFWTMDDVAVAGVHHRRFQIGNVTQRVHVVVQILEDRRSLPQDAVAAEYRVLLDQVEHYVVGGVSGGVNHADCGALYCEFLTVLQEFDGTTIGDVLPFAPRVLPHLGVLRFLFDVEDVGETPDVVVVPMRDEDMGEVDIFVLQDAHQVVDVLRDVGVAGVDKNASRIVYFFVSLRSKGRDLGTKLGVYQSHRPLHAQTKTDKSRASLL
jgi:hypothetical protein